MNAEEAMIESCIRLRGKIIDLTINLEVLLSTYISQRFAINEDKEDEFILLVLGKMTSKLKFELFQELFLQYSNQTIEFKESLFKNLTQIIKNRNCIAHRMLDVSESAVSLFDKNKMLTFHNFDGTNVYNRKANFKKMCIYEKEANEMYKLIAETHNSIIPFIETK